MDVWRSYPREGLRTGGALIFRDVDDDDDNAMWGLTNEVEPASECP